jgi:hypothetical protein
MQAILSPIRLGPPSNTPTATRNWAVGQILDATVVGRDGENSIRLRLAGDTVRAATTLPLQPGDKLKLKVTQLKPVVILTPNEPAQAPAKNSARCSTTSIRHSSHQPHRLVVVVVVVLLQGHSHPQLRNRCRT